MSRTPRPTPGIRATPSGKWQARYYDPSGRLRGKTFVRKSDARDFLTSVKVDVKQGKWVDPALAATPYEEWAQKWLGNKLNLRPTSLKRDEECLRLRLLPSFGKTQLQRIARSDVQGWVKKLAESGLAPATVRRCYRILRSTLAEAVDERLLGESPCRRTSLPRLANREQLYLTAEEVEQLAAAMPERYRALVYSAVYLGCRWGELVGLKRENVDVLRRHVRIVGTLEEIGSHCRYVEETKTATSRRMLTMPPFLAEALAGHMALKPKSEFVFVGPEGALLRRSNFRRRHWKTALKASGLDVALRFHDLRHSCAALLIAQGAHPKEIQARLGHASITTTLNTYGHLWPSLGAQLDDKMEQAFRQARTDVACRWPGASGTVLPMPSQGAGDEDGNRP